MLTQDQKEKIIETANENSELSTWSKGGKFRIYVNYGNQSRGYITFSENNDVRGRNSGEENGMAYCANRPGNVSSLCYAIQEVQGLA